MSRFRGIFREAGIKINTEFLEPYVSKFNNGSLFFKEDDDEVKKRLRVPVKKFDENYYFNNDFCTVRGDKQGRKIYWIMNHLIDLGTWIIKDRQCTH